MSTTPAFLENSVIIAAHPDDEMLWFTSIVGKVDRVVIVFRDFWASPELGKARENAIAHLPLRDVTCLDLPEPGTYGCADWRHPRPSAYGLRLGLEETRREAIRLGRRVAGAIRRSTRAVGPQRVDRHYRANFDRICATLEPMLKPDMNVFTHNPWGEYGHEDHVQVFRALDHLRRKIGFRLWISNYCSERSLPLAMRYLSKTPDAYIRLPSDTALAREIADVYRRFGCWTWAEDWAWFEDECFMEAPREEAGGAQARLMPLNFFSIENAVRRAWPKLPLMASSAVGASVLAVALLRGFL
ncbi:PIG-L family deacetylase [Mangrovibrevibacter kandeliae]|uniref:PIG-L family deacetylase n=1 Tax=Mangrovibrevibacter kandeliae TaxID=2968473 RepID=UPI002118BD0B|nr:MULTISPECIES: PIG-L family deacetylase [unclassified Aurantimonas]MCQ8781276.1 PIG-L family deacetylase [Aurantimonas sp. CSK15Z-1]MCW4114058.1 PIG-L family deacetylase [Aurantimonas sp. MSK8Z-1]